MKYFALSLVAAGCLAASGPAGAEARSSATLGSLVITLGDLNPTDGITPWVTVDPTSRANVVADASGYGDSQDGYVSIKFAPERAGPLATQASSGWSSATTSVMAADNAAGFTALSARGQAASTLDGYGAFRAYANASEPLASFTLSPLTSITFTALSALSVATSMGYNLDADMDEYAEAKSLLNVFGNVNGIFQIDSQGRDLYAAFDVRDDNTTMGVQDSWSGELSVTFFNFGTVETTVGLQAFALAEGKSALWDGVTPVPEPETYAMWLAGLGLMGALARRRRRYAPHVAVAA
ncbi:PEP-CTERM sorting domain-containing protein [Oxalobacteraceae bacterium A2-2]